MICSKVKTKIVTRHRQGRTSEVPFSTPQSHHHNQFRYLRKAARVGSKFMRQNSRSVGQDTTGVSSCWGVCLKMAKKEE